jgi:hypothetical protein
MRQTVRRVANDLRDKRYIDLYSVAIVSIALAVLSLATDVVPYGVRWAVLFAALGILVLRMTIPSATSSSIESLLADRFAFEGIDISARLQEAKEVWVFAPSAVNLLTAHNCESLRKGPLSRSDGAVRIVVLDAKRRDAVELATRQLDYSLDFPIQDFATSLQGTIRLLQAMAAWKVVGNFAYGFLDYNPGFSLVAVDPSSRQGFIIVEFHGFHNEATSSRMHIRITRSLSERWYAYWADQYSRIWEQASVGT